MGFKVGQSLLNFPSAFVPIYIVSDIWQQTGWNCIIYLAALGSIDPELYEAAHRRRKPLETDDTRHPTRMPTIILLLIPNRLHDERRT